MLLTLSFIAVLASVVAIFLFRRLRGVHGQLAELKSTVERGAQIADAVFADLNKAQAELAWTRDSSAVAQKTSEAGLWFWYMERDRVVFSPTWRLLLGFATDDLAEASLESFADLLHPEDVGRVMKKLRDFPPSSASVFNAQYRMKSRAGTYRWFHGRGGRITDPQGGGDVLVVSQQDISESKQLEAAMMDTQLHFRSLYETAPIVFVQWDKEGRIVDWNKFAEGVFGRARAEVMGTPFIRQFSELHQEIFLESIHRLIAGQATTSQLPCVNVTSDGRTLYLEWTNVVFRTIKGTVAGVISLGVDVTARKREEEELMQYRFDLEEQVAARTRELQAAQDSLRQIIEGSPYPTFVIDAQHRITHWNKACEAMFEATEEHVRGQAKMAGQILYGYPRDTLADMVLGNDLAQIEERFGTAAHKSTLIDGAYNGESYLPKRNLWLSFTATPLHDNQGRIIGAIETLADITQRKVAEQKLVEARELAEDAAKAKADFLANMSHEIRTPMNAIIGLTQLALKTQLSSKQRDYLEKISGAGNMLFALVNDVLDFSKIEAGKMSLEEREFTLDDVLISTSTMVLTRAQEKGLELRFKVGETVPQLLLGDSLRLNQVLVNLVGNAIKFTESGSVTVNFGVAEQGEGRIKLLVDVIDTGIGMTQEQSSRLFQAFSQADTSTTRKFGGTGLGLIISKRIVELMNGEIFLTSQSGVGTTFTFTFWCGVASHESASHRLPEVAQGARVLVVDDDAEWCEMFVKMLTRLGFRAEYRTSAEEALTCFEPRHSDPIKLAFIDWRMPQISGITLVQQIFDRYSGVPPKLVMVSKSDLQTLEQAIGNLPIAGVLIKPVTSLHVANLAQGLFDPQGEGLMTRLIQPEADFGLHEMRVLVVDDVATNQMIATEILNDQGVEVDVASSGEESIAKLTAGEIYDVVLMDIQMPGMDGYETTRRIRSIAQFEELPIVAMTAHAMEEEKNKCLEAGMEGFVTKPINPPQLYRVLAQWNKRRSSVTPAFSPESPELAQQAAVPTAVEESALFPQLRGIDTAVGLQFMMNKPAVYEKVLKDFHARFKDTVHDVRLAIARGEQEEARRQAHSLKSLAGSIGAKALSASALDLEMALGESDKPDSGVIEAFEESLAEVLEGLSEQFVIQ